MVVDNAVNKICVRLVDIKTENMVQAYYTENLEHTLAMYNYCKEHDISVYVGEEGQSQKECTIEDIDILFGGGDCLLSLNLYCSIIDWGK